MANQLYKVLNINSILLLLSLLTYVFHRATGWTETTIKDIEEHHLLFPQLNEDSINPVALELVSGPHAIQRAYSVITYMGQLELKGRNLTREEASLQLQRFPENWKVHYCDIKTPTSFVPTENQPYWSPEWWDEVKFGP